MTRIYDRMLLESAASLYRRFPALPARPLRWLGLDLSAANGLYSARWSRLGVVPCRLRSSGKWVMLNMGYASQRYTFVYGMYVERDIEKFLERVLGKGDVFIDIGANIGMITLQGASLVGPTGSVWAVEANPSACSMLSAHTSLNRLANVRVYNIALGAAPGSVNLRIPREGLGDQTLAESTWGNLRSDGSDRDQVVQVTMDKGDNILDGIPRDAKGVCKIDVEGFEMEVLRGMEAFVQSHPRIQYCVEVTDEWIRGSSGVGATYLLEWFRKKGFASFSLRKDGSITPIRTTEDKFTQDDLVFAVPGSTS